MKRLSNYLLAGFAATMLLFTSCADDEETDKSPVLTLTGGTEYVSSDVTLTVGEEFLIGVTATPNASTSEKLVGLTMVATFNNVPETIIDTTLDKLTSFNLDVYSYAQAIVGTERIVITVTDKAGETAEKVINITTEEGALDLKEFTAVLMGGQSNLTTGSFLDVKTGTVYKQTAAEASSELIDIIYYFGSTNKASLVAPDDATVNGGSGNLSLATNFSTKNSTRFNNNPGITAAEFDAMTNDSDIADLTASDSKANLLSVNDVVVFETEDGRMGAFKVSAIDGDATGTITIAVKIQ